MKDLEKVNISQLVAVFKNFATGILIVMATLLLSDWLPFYFSPIIGLIAAAVLYTILYNNKFRRQSTCMLVPYGLFFCMIAYSFGSILLNVLFIWNIVKIPQELSFFADPYIPTLLMDPICFVTLLVVYIRRRRLHICVDCRITKGLSIERGKLGEILRSESRVQLVNLIWIFGLQAVVEWVYYLGFYVNTNISSRDEYVFIGINLIVFGLDLLYFASRYYNLYLDLKENGEIITEDELSDMTAKTYLRYYVVCGNNIYLNSQTVDPSSPFGQVADTPFVTKRNVNGITIPEVKEIIAGLTGDPDGELRFLFGRRSMDLAKHRLLRYVYFLNPRKEAKGEKEDAMQKAENCIDGGEVCPVLKMPGEWLDFDAVKMLYNEAPGTLSNIFLSDITRITTIILTQKIFHEDGTRKIKAKSYIPSWDLLELRSGDYDFQDDKWIRVSMFNSDNRGFMFRRWWINHFRKKRKSEWERRR